MTIQHSFDVKHRSCRHHRFKYLHRNYYGMYLFECVRPTCQARYAIHYHDFWKKGNNYPSTRPQGFLR